jgi:alpha-L-rhamnosidase
MPHSYQHTSCRNRYIEVTIPHGSLGSDLTGVVEQLERTECYPMRSDFNVVANYTMPSTLLEQIHNLTVHTFDSNMLSVESDCPARERLGYGDDAHAGGEAALTIYDLALFDEKRVRVRGAFSDGNLHSRMPLDLTHVRLKRTCV